MSFVISQGNWFDFVAQLKTDLTTVRVVHACGFHERRESLDYKKYKNTFNRRKK